MEQEQVTEEVLDRAMRELLVSAVKREYQRDAGEGWASFVPECKDIVTPYCILRSIERQEQLMHRMDRQSKVMTGLTYAIFVLTAVIVVKEVGLYAWLQRLCTSF